jgi:hypothetical protein
LWPKCGDSSGALCDRKDVKKRPASDKRVQHPAAEKLASGKAFEAWGFA